MEKKEKKYFFPPFCDYTEKIILEVLNYYKKEGKKINAYPEEKIHLLKNIEELLVFEDDRDNYDYVYLTKDLISLPGRKYDGKRNNIKNFYKNYKFEFIELIPALIQECLSFQEHWCLMKKCEDDLSLTNENEAVNEILKNYNSLPVFGAVIKINGKIQGFTIGSELNRETGEVIVEKANSEFAGIYQALNQLFCENFLKKYKYVNRQQDTGAPGLRKTKMSYHPFKLIKKYNIGLKNQ